MHDQALLEGLRRQQFVAFELDVADLVLHALGDGEFDHHLADLGARLHQGRDLDLEVAHALVVFA